MKKIKKLIVPISFSLLLIGCSGKELNGNWRLADNDTTCPVSYQFDKKIEVNPENKKKKTIWLIEMHTQKIANEYNMNLNVELKGITGPNGLALSKSMVKQVEEQLTNLNQNQEVLISSFNVVLVKLAEEIMPQYNRAVIFHTTSFREDWRTLLDYCNAKIVNTEDAKLTKAKVKMVKEAGYELNVWTVNKPARANQLANWGVDGIFTDNADKMVHLSQ